MVMISTADFKKGAAIIFKGEPCLIEDFTFVSPGKGSAFYRTKLRNLKDGQVSSFTFKSGEKVEEAEVGVRELQYLYNDRDKYYFMNPKTFEQMELEAGGVGDFKDFIKGGEVYQIYVWEGKPVSLRPPPKVELKVVEAGPGAKGDTATAATKVVTLETGHKVNVPLFIKENDKVVVNTETGEYVSRA